MSFFDMLEHYHWAFQKGISQRGWIALKFVRMCYAILNYTVKLLVHHTLPHRWTISVNQPLLSLPNTHLPHRGTINQPPLSLTNTSTTQGNWVNQSPLSLTNTHLPHRETVSTSLHYHSQTHIYHTGELCQSASYYNSNSSIKWE